MAGFGPQHQRGDCSKSISIEDWSSHNSHNNFIWNAACIPSLHFRLAIVHSLQSICKCNFSQCQGDIHFPDVKGTAEVALMSMLIGSLEQMKKIPARIT